MQTKVVIEKWYKRLGFPEKYDAEFYKALENIEISPDTCIEKYDMECEDGKKNLLSFLYLCEGAEKSYKELGIPEDIMLDTLRDVVVWTETWSAVKGELYLGEILWLKRHFEIRLFKLGRLQFCIAGAEHDIPKYGIKKGEPLIEVHIQAGGRLSTEECNSSIDMARAFLKKYFPNYEYSVFTCHSWLLDEKLEEVLAPDSNILKFGRMFDRVRADDSNALLRYIFPWDTNEENLKNREPVSGFARRVKEAVVGGATFHETLGVIKA